MKKQYLVLLASVFLVGHVHAKTSQTETSIFEKAEKDEVVITQKQDPYMLKAYQLAKEGLPDFLKHYQKRDAHPEWSSFSVKVGLSDGSNTEYAWINAIASSDEQHFTGNINNEIRLVSGYQAGQAIHFKREEIVDWTYLDENKGMKGNFTACALLMKEPAAARIAFQRQYGLACPFE